MVKISEVKGSNVRYRYYRLRKAVLAGLSELWISDSVKIVEVSAYGSRACIIERNRAIRRAMAKSGFKYEDCFCVAVTEKDGLCCLKGLLRFKRSLTDGRLLEVLKAFWCKRLQTDVRVVAWGRELELRRYIRDEMLQAVADGEFAGRHLAMSKGWKLARGAVSGSDWFHKVEEKVEKPVVVVRRRVNRYEQEAEDFFSALDVGGRISDEDLSISEEVDD